LKKNVSEETTDSSEDEVEGLVKRAKLGLKNSILYTRKTMD